MYSKPNIVIVNPDHYRGEALAHMGNACVQTPNLDNLCEAEGVSFRNAFCQNPVCTPSRCCFMTGWYPHVRGHRTMFHMLRQDEPDLLSRLKDAGYFVWWGGKNDLYYPRLSLQAQEGPEHTKAIMCRTKSFKYIRRVYEQDELYDLEQDPEELHNVIGDPSYQKTIDQLKDRMLTWYITTSDVVPFDIDSRG